MTTSARRSRVLIVSHWFAPYSTIASIRATKLAKHLLDQGWDVRVLAAGETDADKSLPLEIPRDCITYASWDPAGHQIEAVRTRIASFRLAKQSATGDAESASDRTTGGAPAKRSSFRTALSNAYRDIIEWPDNRAGWRKHALASGMKIVADWRPDVIFATAPPATALIVADRLSRNISVPWVAEMRDLWTDHPYYENSRLRLFFERIWDRRVLSRAAAIVTVSPGWRQRLVERYRRPVVVAMNGFVAGDFPMTPPVTPETAGPLRIVFTGHIYTGFRDPSPLFAAIEQRGLQPSQVLVEFVGTKDKEVWGLAHRYGLSEHIRIHPPVPYARALELQLRADVLLHMQWCDPKEQGTIAGKIFDYLGARRPILGIALEDSVVAELIRARNAGLVTNDPQKIAQQVEIWIAEKRSGGIAPLPATASLGLERSVQFEKIERLLRGVTQGRLLSISSQQPVAEG